MSGRSMIAPTPLSYPPHRRGDQWSPVFHNNLRYIMKKYLSIIILLFFSFALSGCGSIYSNYREIEQLLVIRTMGLDYSGRGIELSLASSSAGSGNARTLSAAGDSISTAMDRIYNYSYEEELFCSHIGELLIGEKLAEEGIQSCLNYICRSPVMRLDTPLYVVRGATARETIMNAGGTGKGIAEVMDSVEVSAERRGDSSIFTAADVMRDLDRCGSALICALEYGTSSESTDAPASGGGDSGGSSSEGSESSSQSSSEESGGQSSSSEGSGDLTAAIAGYAIIRDGKLCRYLDRDQAIAVGFLKNDTGISDVTVNDRYGSPVVLEINGGSSSIRPVWAAPGELKGINIHVDVRASVIETSGSSRLTDAEYTDQLVAAMEAYISGCVSETLSASKELRSDFLGLAPKVEKTSPENYRLMTREFADILPELELQISVSGQISHTNDMKDS